MGLDRAGVSYWDSVWDRAAKQRSKRSSLGRYTEALLTEFLAELPQKAVVLEAGCANSAALPFVHQLGFHAVGIDYSAEGCRQLRETDPQLTVYQGDIFAPPEALLGSADAVFSLGLVEHFEPPALAVRAMTKMLRPGGRMLTVVPNMYGTVGWLQKHLNRQAFDVHVRIDLTDLVQAHDGMQIVEVERLAPVGFGVVNPGSKFLPRAVVSAMARLSELPRAIDNAVPLPKTRILSPHLYCIARAQPMTESDNQP